jgi:hypothetical protein
MKKFILTILLILFITIPIFAEENTVCGNTYLFYYNDVNYILKFESSNPELPCTSGVSTLYWFDSKLMKNFSINSKGFITITGIGKFILDTGKLYFLDTTDIIFNQL